MGTIATPRGTQPPHCALAPLAHISGMTGRQGRPSRRGLVTDHPELLMQRVVVNQDLRHNLP